MCEWTQEDERRYQEIIRGVPYEPPVTMPTPAPEREPEKVPAGR